MAISIGFDTTTDSHVSWFDATVTRTTTDTHSGAGALSWAAVQSFTGVNLSNFPYFAHGESVGAILTPKVWMKGSSGAYDTTIDWTIHFHDSGGTTVGSTITNTLTINGTWQQFTGTDMTVPAGAPNIAWEFFANAAAIGSVILIDDITFTAAPPPPQDEGSKNASAMRAMTGGRF